MRTFKGWSYARPARITFGGFFSRHWPWAGTSPVGGHCQLRREVPSVPICGHSRVGHTQDPHALHLGVSFRGTGPGREHLLLVVIASYVEKYHRFRYADIQGLVIRKTRTHYIWGFLFAALALGGNISCWWSLPVT